MTVCTHGRQSLFGEIIQKEMRLNPAGEMIACWWRGLAGKFPAVRTDAFIAMPNHVHGLLAISNLPVGADLCVRPAPLVSPSELPSLSHVVQWFKTMTTNEYLRRVKSDGWPRLQGKLWQRNYYEHIVRRSSSCDRIRQYILDNPGKWQLDAENPARSGSGADEIEGIIRDDL